MAKEKKKEGEEEVGGGYRERGGKRGWEREGGGERVGERVEEIE